VTVAAPSIDGGPVRSGALAGKRVLVTGGSRGIGRALACRAADEGAESVAFLYLQDEEAASTTAKEVRERGAEPLAIRADVADEAAVRAALARVRSELGLLEVVFANAGMYQDQALGLMSLARWQRVVDVNLTGTFLTIRESMKQLRRAGGGAIVVLGSVAGRRAFPHMANYSSTKAGLEALVRSAAVEGAEFGIRANLLVPGLVRTDMASGIVTTYGTDFLPVGRAAEPEEVAGCAMFLASDAAGYVTGTSLLVDGGLSLV
jgi:NAD(P)-dependent dehydrogenase (short-subunit alcohol dehydrogenase family)